MIMGGSVGNATGTSSWSGELEGDARRARARSLKVALRGDVEGVRRARAMLEMRGKGASELSDCDGLWRESLSTDAPASLEGDVRERGDDGADFIACEGLSESEIRIPGRLTRRV